MSTVRTANTTEKTATLRRLAECREETSQTITTGTRFQTINKHTHRSTTCATTRSSPINKQRSVNRHTETSIQENSHTRASDVSERHSSNESTHHDHATTVTVTDGRHPDEQIHPKHHAGNITEHAGHTNQMRVPHWNAQCLNSIAKQSALIAALQLDHIDVALIQDSRISAKNDGKQPIRVPNCYTN